VLSSQPVDNSTLVPKAVNRPLKRDNTIYRLERSLASTPTDADVVLARIRELRESTALPPLTDDLVRQATELERP